MSEHFPMFRLATLLARQMSSPIASRIKEAARRHPRFGRAVCMRLGRALGGAELRCKLWLLRLRRPARAPALSDAAALGAGADVLGEIIVFSLGASIIVFEVNRQANNLEEKKLSERSRWVAVFLQLEELQRELELQQEELDRMLTTLRRVATESDRDRRDRDGEH